MVARGLVALCVFVLTGGCRGSDDSDHAPNAPNDGSNDDRKRDDKAPGPNEKPEGKTEPDRVEPSALIADLGAIPAWQAVVDRAQLLARRKQRGVVYGRLAVPDPAGPVWLVDDTEGHGSLAIRVEGVLNGGPGKPGDRVALSGAWHLDAAKTWVWRATDVRALPPAVPDDLKDPPAARPGHDIANGDLPQGARTISIARDGDAIYFQIVGPPPVSDGDGWLVADELGDTPVALLSLPGERASYGGQDMRTANERWQLRKAQTYWVRIGKIRSRGLDKPAIMHARTAPVRVN